MRLGSVIEIDVMIMVRLGHISQLAELITQSKRKIVICCFCHGPYPCLRYETGAVNIFPVQSAYAPDRCIKVCKRNTFLAHLAKGRRVLFIYGKVCEAFCGDIYKVFAFKNPGHFICLTISVPT